MGLCHGITERCQIRKGDAFYRKLHSVWRQMPPTVRVAKSAGRWPKKHPSKGEEERVSPFQNASFLYIFSSQEMHKLTFRKWKVLS